MCVRGNQRCDFVSESMRGFTQGWRINSQELSYLFGKKGVALTVFQRRLSERTCSLQLLFLDEPVARNLPCWEAVVRTTGVDMSLVMKVRRLGSSPWISFDNEEHIRIEQWPHSLRVPRCPILSSPGQLNNQHPWTSSGASIMRELSFLKTHTSLFSRASNWHLATVLCGVLFVQKIFLIAFFLFQHWEEYSADRMLDVVRRFSFLWVLGSMAWLVLAQVDQWEGISHRTLNLHKLISLL